MFNNLFSYILRTIPRPVLIRGSLVFRKFSALLFRGNEVECPVCGKSFSRFLPYGRLLRKNALCPNCLSLERHRLLWLYLKERTDFFIQKHKVLHIAPEQCFYKRFKKLKNLDYTTADLISPIADINFDIQSIPFNDNTFDVVICNHVLEHVDNDHKAIREIHRILKNNGFAILMVPIDFERSETLEDKSINTPALREKFYWQNDHKRLYGLDYPKRVENAGLKSIENNFTDEINEEKRNKYRLPENELLKAFRKTQET